ncbi:MAG: molybdopterin dinucleotide binding domain-containing protein [Promethearchaeota archaeon]
MKDRNQTLEVVVITGRTIDQGRAIEGKKISEDLLSIAAICELCQEDMDKLNVKEGETVKLMTDYGENIFIAKPSKSLDSGIVFIPMGLWANRIISPNTGNIGMPSFKGVRGTLVAAPGEKPSTPKKFIKNLLESKQ